jgi:hypothetical protein
MRILFVMKQPAEMRGLEPALRLLEHRGHSIHLAYQGIKDSGSHAALVALTEECEQITAAKLPRVGSSKWTRLARSLRLTADHLRYLEPPFEDATRLRADTAKRAPAAARRLGRIAAGAGPRGVKSVRKLLQHLERCVPPAPSIERFVAEQRPDVMLITPLVTFGSRQADFLRAAKRLGIRTCYVVQSWDNLTTKGLLRDVPDLVLVWNEIQADEAELLQGVPRNRIRVTGSPGWDHWFDRIPQRTREEFCREVGLRPDRPIVLYAGSHPWVIGGDKEVDFVRRWTAVLRAHGGLLADVGILVRQHPARNKTHWTRARLDDPQVAVWPLSGEHPFDESTRQNYFESIYYASAVFGINTSAQIESAIVGRPVHTLLADEFQQTQGATIHFNYLQADEFGLLHVARTMEEHAAMLEASLRGTSDDGRNERFVERFVRPFGRGAPATPFVVEAIEELAAQPAPAPDRGPALAPVVRLALQPLAALATWGAARRRRAKTATPARKPQAAVRRLIREAGTRPVVAGPWLGDEIGELLYWIPFLRHAQTAASGLRERLWVVARSESLSWYQGVGARHLLVDDLVSPDDLAALAERFPGDELRALHKQLSRVIETEDFGVLPPHLIAAICTERLHRDPAAARVQRRMLDRVLEFGPLVPPSLPADIELPGAFFAIGFAFGDAYPETAENLHSAVESVGALARRTTVVGFEPSGALKDGLMPLVETGQLQLLGERGRKAEMAVLARARGFLGSYGSSPFVAALLGVPAVALYSRQEQVADEDLEIAASFLDREPFGHLQTLEAVGLAGETAEVVVRSLEQKAEMLSLV